MRSADKLDIVALDTDDKLWFGIRHKWLNADGLWIPSFEDWFRMIQALKACERQKYTNLRDPVAMIRRFFARCCDDVDWETVRREFRIPDRSRG